MLGHAWLVRRVEDLTEQGRQGGRVNGVGENTTPRAGVGHGWAGEAKQCRQGVSPQPRPISEGFDTAVTGEFGEDGNGKERRERIAYAARVALIDEVRELGSQGMDADGEGDGGRYRKHKRIYGRLHRTPFWALVA